ncbi:MAG: DUF2809 domain-containing protein [Actinomycetota bacterium]
MARRARLAAALVATLATGLASRRIDALPDLIGDHAGDALWTTAVVLGLALVFGMGARTAALAGFGISVLVELSQRWKPAWLETLRDNDLVALVIGRGWVWGDLVRYATGAALGALIVASLDRPAPSPAAG